MPNASLCASPLSESTRGILRALVLLLMSACCLPALAVDELPWGAIKGVSAVSALSPDGVPVEFVFAPTENILDGGQVWYRSVNYFANAHQQAWDPRGWREIPGGMRTSYRLASTWVSKPDAPPIDRTIWVAAIDDSGHYRIGSYKPWAWNGESWGGWFQMGSPPTAATFNGPPAIVSHGDYVRLFAPSNGKLWVRTWSDLTQSWDDWKPEAAGLHPGTGIAVSAMRMNFASDEKAVLVAVREDRTLMWRVYGHGPDNFWKDVPGGGLTDVTPALAHSSPTRLRLIVKGINAHSLHHQTLTDGALWQGWKMFANDSRFDSTPAPFHGAGGPSANWLPSSGVLGDGSVRPVAKGALHVYIDGDGTFQTVHATRLRESSLSGNLQVDSGCIVNCSAFPEWQELPGTAVPTLTLQPIPTMPQMIPPPHHAMVASDGPAQQRPCAPLFADVRATRMPIYGTDFLLGRTHCGGFDGKTRLYWRSGANLGRANTRWDARGWAELPGVNAYQGHDIATVGNELWAAAVEADGRILMTRITGFDAYNQLHWEDWQDISANLDCGQEACPLFVEGPPGIVVANGFVSIWVRDTQGFLWRRKYDRTAGAWQGDWVVDDAGFQVAPLHTVSGTEIVQGGKKRTLLVAVRSDAPAGSIYYKVPEVSDNWMLIPGGGKSDASPAVARGADNRVHVVVRGLSGGVYWYQTMTDGLIWNTSWATLPGGGIFHTGASRGPVAVFRAGGYVDPVVPSAASWDATPALHVYGGAGTDGKALFGTSFVANGTSLQLREQGWKQLPSTGPVPAAPGTPKPPMIEGPDGTLYPPPPQPGTPEWNAPAPSEPINQWYPFCLSWSLWDGWEWSDDWSKTIYYPGENFTDADDFGWAVMVAANQPLHPDGLVDPGEHAYQSWVAGACP
jgi:hypothetical protein